MYLLHPLNGLGYQFWSGIGSDFGELTIFTALVLILRHHNCHVKGCRRLGHHDLAVGAPSCKAHHSMRENRK